MFDHALRCGEVAALDVQDIRLDPALGTGSLHIHSIKIKDEHEAALTPDTYDAALAYLAYLPSKQEPLFVGKISKERIDERSIYHRVQLLGRRIGLTLDISPHDGRHFFVDDALNPENENSLAAIQQAGRWKSPAMVMRYATEKKIINEGLKLTATRKRGEA
jgi:integrase